MFSKKKQEEEEAEQKKIATETAYQGMVSLTIYLKSNILLFDPISRSFGHNMRESRFFQVVAVYSCSHTCYLVTI